MGLTELVSVFGTVRSCRPSVFQDLVVCSGADSSPVAEWSFHLCREG